MEGRAHGLHASPRVGHRHGWAVPWRPWEPGRDPWAGWAVTAWHGALATEPLSSFAVRWAVPVWPPGVGGSKPPLCL